MTITIRPERPGDVEAVRTINIEAFGQPAEAGIVDAIRGACPDILSLVAEDEGEPVGHILFSPAVVSDGDREVRGMGLAPMAVASGRQREGIGSRLVRAGLEILRRLEKPGTYEKLERTSRTLALGLAERALDAGVELSTAWVGGMFGFFFHPGPVRCFEDAQKARAERFRRFFAAMLERGVYLPPSPFEACFASLAHRRADLEETLDAAEFALRRAARVD